MAPLICRIVLSNCALLPERLVLLLCVEARAKKPHSQACARVRQSACCHESLHLLDDVVGHLRRDALGVDHLPITILVGVTRLVGDLDGMVPETIRLRLQPRERYKQACGQN